MNYLVPSCACEERWADEGQRAYRRLVREEEVSGATGLVVQRNVVLSA